MSEMHGLLAKEVRYELPEMHSLSGCNTVTAFTGKEKCAAYKLTIQNAEFRDALTALGTQANVSNNETMKQLYDFQLYYRNTNYLTSVNSAILFSLQKRGLWSCITFRRNTLYIHVMRFNCHALVWKKVPTGRSSSSIPR